MIVTYQAPDDLQRIPMSWEEFLRHDHPENSEYLGGCLIRMAPATKKHQLVIKRLERLLDAHLPHGAQSLQSVGWSPRGVREHLVPDVLVFRDIDDEALFSGIPLLVVEVVSTNRNGDMVAKRERYAAWGAPSYWIVDPREHEVLTMELRDGGFVETGRFSGGEATLRYGAVEVPVDVDALLA
jgi:Uma2 family endonuclease